MSRDSRKYGLNAADRDFELLRKFGSWGTKNAMSILSAATDPTDHILGAVIFLAKTGHLEDLDDLVKLANQDRNSLLRAATVKDERG